MSVRFNPLDEYYFTPKRRAQRLRDPIKQLRAMVAMVYRSTTKQQEMKEHVLNAPEPFPDHFDLAGFRLWIDGKNPGYQPDSFEEQFAVWYSERIAISQGYRAKRTDNVDGTDSGQGKSNVSENHDDELTKHNNASSKLVSNSTKPLDVTDSGQEHSVAPHSPDEDRWMKQVDVARKLNDSSTAISRLVEAGKLKTNGKRGTDKRIDVLSVVKYCDEHGLSYNDGTDDITKP